MKSISIWNTKLSCWPAEVPRMKSTLFKFTVICQNDQELPRLNKNGQFVPLQEVDSFFF